MKRLSLLVIVLLTGALIFLVMPAAYPGRAAPAAQVTTPDPNLSISDEYCSSCHGRPGQTMTLGDGSELDLYVDPEQHTSSIHGSQGYACVQCHTNVGQYPHPDFVATDRRNVTLQLTELCKRCHSTESLKTRDGVHAEAMSVGQREAATCVDCHSAHAVQEWVDNETGKTLPEARIQIPQTCSQCHSAIYEKYKTTVHGAALTDENNPDVPTCIDCHGVHSIEDPTTASFRLSSPRLCANCHTDPAVMTKYGISTDVLDTYVADFHGTTVAIFEKQSPDQETNKPVCYDCHGIHDIKSADDPEKGLHVKENLLITCQKCHPDAMEQFPDAWLSHYIPSAAKYPIVYYVDLFYKFFIPTVLGGMAVLVVLDLSRRTINSRKQKEAIPPAAELPAGQEPEQAAPAQEITAALPDPETGNPPEADASNG